jgi:hypothetical protein
MTAEAIGIVMSIIGGIIIGPALLLHRRVGHLIAPRPIVVVYASLALMIIGLLIVLNAELLWGIKAGS